MPWRVTTLIATIRKARNLTGWPLREKVLFVLAWPLLGASRGLVVCAPFRYLTPWLGEAAGIAPWIPITDFLGEARAVSIGKAVRRAASVTPWRSNCLAQAITAKVLLGLYRIPCSTFFGVARGSTAAGPRLSAHAWVRAGRIPVTGGAGFERFAVVGCFVSRQR